MLLDLCNQKLRAKSVIGSNEGNWKIIEAQKKHCAMTSWHNENNNKKLMLDVSDIASNQ